MNIGGTAATVAGIVETCANIKLQMSITEKAVKELRLMQIENDRANSRITSKKDEDE
jgi:hypothetical protein